MEERIQEILTNNPTESTPIDDIVDLLSELVTEYQAKAWDKGWAKGATRGISPKRLSYVYPPTKDNKNPYRAQLEHHNRRKHDE